MARKMTEWPSKRGPITKIMPSDGCIGDTVPLAVGKWYDFHEFGWHMGNVGYGVTEKFLRKGYSIQCPTIHGWGQRLIPPFASVPDDEVYCAQLDVPFEENQLIVIEPSPCAPDLSSGFFFGGLNRVSSSGGEALQQFPFELIVKN